MSNVVPLTRPSRPSFERGDHVELAQALLGQLRSDGGAVVFDDGALYREDPATHVFAEVSPNHESRIVQSFAGAHVGKKELRIRATDVTGAIALAHAAADQPGYFADAPSGVAFLGTFARVTADGIETEPLATKHRARFAYPFAYDSETVPERFLAFLRATFEGDDDADAKIACVQDVVGACMVGMATRHQKALIMLGGGANGKSVLCEIIEALMPPGSVVSIEPQSWGSEYRLAMLAGKLLNIVSELPDTDIMASEAFKKLLCGEAATARHIRQQPFTFHARAGHIFAANTLPGTTDTTHAFFRRVIILEFNQTVPPERQDPDLARKIIEAELPAIVAWALAGAQSAAASGRYVIPASSDAAVERWRDRADAVRAFVADCCTPIGIADHPTEGTPGRELYRAYRSWAHETGHRTMASNTFGLRMTAIGHPAVRVHAGTFYRLRVEVLS